MGVILRLLRGVLKDDRGNSAGQDILVRTRSFTIGQASDCQLRCASPLLDAHHCTITLESHRIVIRDFNTKQGTYLNEKRIDGSACLFHGDRISVGRLQFEVVVHPQPRQRTPAIAHKRAVRGAPRPLIVPMRDTVPESVAKRLATNPRLAARRQAATPKSRESAFPRQF